MNANSTIPPPQKWRLRLRHWPGKTRPKEREWLFFSFLIILSAGYAAFALVAWGLDFHAGVLANGLGIVAMSVLGALRWRGFRLGPLITALQTLTLAQAFAVTWLTGGIYSATIG